LFKHNLKIILFSYKMPYYPSYGYPYAYGGYASPFVGYGCSAYLPYGPCGVSPPCGYGYGCARPW
jgi:hypothetical protein